MMQDVDDKNKYIVKNLDSMLTNKEIAVILKENIRWTIKPLQFIKCHIKGKTNIIVGSPTPPPTADFQMGLDWIKITKFVPNTLKRTSNWDRAFEKYSVAACVQYNFGDAVEEEYDDDEEEEDEKATGASPMKLDQNHEVDDDANWADATNECETNEAEIITIPLPAPKRKATPWAPTRSWAGIAKEDPVTQSRTPSNEPTIAQLLAQLRQVEDDNKKKIQEQETNFKSQIGELNDNIRELTMSAIQDRTDRAEAQKKMDGNLNFMASQLLELTNMFKTMQGHMSGGVQFGTAGQQQVTVGASNGNPTGAQAVPAAVQVGAAPFQFGAADVNMASTGNKPDVAFAEPDGKVPRLDTTTSAQQQNIATGNSGC